MTSPAQPDLPALRRELQQINWAEFDTAYGPATKVPGYLESLFSTDPRTVWSAVGELDNAICHQHVGLSSAVEPAWPFIRRAWETAPASGDTSVQAELLFLCLGLAEGSGLVLERGCTEAWVYELRRELRAEAARFLAFTQHANEDIFEVADMLCAELSLPYIPRPPEDPVLLRARSELSGAGWKPGRAVAVYPAVPPDHPAYALLREFGGLKLNWNTTAVKYETAIGFNGLSPAVAAWAGRLRTTLVGIADHGWGYLRLYLAADGRIFGYTEIDDGFWYYADDFRTALGMLYLGRWARPVFKPGQATVTLHGEEIRADDPRAYPY